MTVEAGLSPCPFCGGAAKLAQQTATLWCAYCAACGAEGPWSKGSEAAVVTWNCRVTGASAWKCGDELSPYHPDASHVEPGYRDGWNACMQLVLASLSHSGAEKLRNFASCRSTTERQAEQETAGGAGR